MPPPRTFTHLYGVDFSGAKLAGRNTWIAHVELTPRGPHLHDLAPLETLCGHADRDRALPALVAAIARSDDALWAMDFPFALPVEIVPCAHAFDDQLRTLARWRQGAYALGLDCVHRTKKYNTRTTNGSAITPKLHIRRLTDTETRTPFDCYHYRIIYQTFHGMRDVLLPLRESQRTAILPFDYPHLRRARSAVIESCPGSTLRRLGWPHNNYKQPTGGPLTSKRRRTRRQILDLLAHHITIDPRHQRTIMRNPGADALDAVLATLAPALRWPHYDHRAIARHARYAREGHVYA
jgi:hypothetical protein